MTAQHPAPTPGSDWWREAVIYQIYPRSFFDSNGDGVGDLPGITARLEHIAALGVNLVWISPFFTSPMKDFGYDVANYCDVDPLFGTLADFDRLIARAHALGLKIMIDQVLSHTADPRPEGTPPTNWLSVFGGPAWAWDTRRRQYYLHNFLTSQPDLNFHQPAVQQAHLDNMRFWLERGVDGFRLDACNFHFHDPLLRNNPPAAKRDSATVSDVNPYGMQAHIYDKTRPENIAFLERVGSLLAEYGAVAIGEVGADDSLAVMADYTAGGNKLQMAYSFDLLTNEYSAAHIRSRVEQFEARVKDGGASWSVGNHDVARVFTRWGGKDATPAFAKMILAMQLCLKGTPCLYQGDELGLPEAELAFEDLQDPYGIAFWPEFKGRDGCRTPMPWDANQPNAGFSSARPWLPVFPAHVPLAAAQQAQDENSVYRFACRIMAWRKTLAQLTRGDISFYDAPEPVLALRRSLPGQPTLLIAFNLGREPLAFDWPQARDAQAISGHGFDGSALEATVTLPGYGAWFAQLA